jgi:hypothetical protein
LFLVLRKGPDLFLIRIGFFHPAAGRLPGVHAAEKSACVFKSSLIE